MIRFSTDTIKQKQQETVKGEEIHSETNKQTRGG
jgi:hypothetical protein